MEGGFFMNRNNKLTKDTDSTEIAGRYFNPSDYSGNTQLEKGLAETHEQVSDDYFEGTIDQSLGNQEEDK